MADIFNQVVLLRDGLEVCMDLLRADIATTRSDASTPYRRVFLLTILSNQGSVQKYMHMHVPERHLVLFQLIQWF